MRGRVRWLAFRIGGQKWGVYLVNPGNKRLKGDPGDLDDEAATYHEECRIYIARGPQEVVEERLVHELFHGVFDRSGASFEIGSPKKEEKIVRDITPVWHGILKDLGFRFPKVQ